MEKTESILVLDAEWLKLIMLAKGMGLKKEEVRVFLEGEKKKLSTG